jgi:hypothetical protein
MRFSAFYVLSGAMLALAAMNFASDPTTAGWLLFSCIVSAVIGAFFEAYNS